MKRNAPPRPRLNRDRVLRTAVSLADEVDIDALSMRRLAQELDVTPMALYKHVADKEALLDGMIEVIVGEIDPPLTGAEWRDTVRHRVLSARRALQRHSWAREVLESRSRMTPPVLGYLDSVARGFLDGGFSPDLTHHVMHALGGRVWGFTQELFDGSRAPATSTAPSPEQEGAMYAQMAAAFPSLAVVASSAAHSGDVVGRGCDDDFEFTVTLDLMLDGFERMRAHGWTSAAALTSVAAGRPAVGAAL